MRPTPTPSLKAANARAVGGKGGTTRLSFSHYNICRCIRGWGMGARYSCDQMWREYAQDGNPEPTYQCAAQPSAAHKHTGDRRSRVSLLADDQDGRHHIG